VNPANEENASVMVKDLVVIAQNQIWTASIVLFLNILEVYLLPALQDALVPVRHAKPVGGERQNVMEDLLVGFVLQTASIV
jgi:hypothetical protein